MTVDTTAIISAINDSMIGGTVRRTAVGSELPTTGYWVGGVVSPLVIDPDDLGGDNVGEIETFVNYITTEFVGWWTDSDDDQLYVDAVTWFESHDDAAKAARERHEIAFWDIARDRELRVAYVSGE